MSGRATSRGRPVAQVQTPAVDDPKIQRALDTVASAVQDLQSRRQLDQFNATDPGYVPLAGTDETLFLRSDGTWAAPGVSGSSGVGGSGTANKIAKWATATTLGDSTITDTGVLVTVNDALLVTGAATFSAAVSIEGNATIGNAGGDAHVVNGTVDFNHAVNVDGTLTLSLMTAGSVLFAGVAGVITQDNANLFFDNTNNYLGVGTNAPAKPLDVRGTPNTHIMELRNTNVVGYSAVDVLDEGGTSRFGWGYNNGLDLIYLSLNNSADMIVTGNGSLIGKVFNSGNWNIGSTTGDPSVKLRVEGSTILGTSIGNTHAVTGNATISGNTSGVALNVSAPVQTNIRIVGDSDSTSSDAAYTGLVIARGVGPTELWFIGRDGTAPSDGLIFRRSGTTNDLKIDTSGHAAFTGRIGVNGAAPPAQASITALTDSSGGTANNTVQALTDPADTPADADALRDDLVANLIPQLRNNYADLAVKINELRTILVNLGFAT